MLSFILCDASASDYLTGGAIDSFLTGLIEHMGTKNPMSVSLTGMAKAIGSIACLIVGAYECFMMMLGKRGIDVMKILRILVISFCITFSGSICSMLKAPGQQIEKMSKEFAMDEQATVEGLEEDVSELSEKFAEALSNKTAQAWQEANAAQNAVDGKEGENKEPSLWQLLNSGQLSSYVKDKIKGWIVSIQTSILEILNKIIKWVAIVIFQVMFYAIMLGQRCFMSLLEVWAPMAFAFSLVPAFKNAWSQWISKYITLSLWGFIAWFIMGYAFYLIEYDLMIDKDAYNGLIATADSTDWGDIGLLGLQQIGSTCMYVIGLLIGAMLLKFVPEVASWLVPGGQGSGFGGAAGGAVTNAAMAAGGFAMGAAATTGAMAAGEAKTVYSDLKAGGEALSTKMFGDPSDPSSGLRKG